MLRPFPAFPGLYERARGGRDVLNWDDQMALLPAARAAEWAMGAQRGRGAELAKPPLDARRGRAAVPRRVEGAARRLAYSTCGSPEQWLEACRAGMGPRAYNPTLERIRRVVTSSRKPGLAPACVPMALLSAFSALTMRQCGYVRDYECLRARGGAQVLSPRRASGTAFVSVGLFPRRASRGGLTSSRLDYLLARAPRAFFPRRNARST